VTRGRVEGKTRKGWRFQRQNRFSTNGRDVLKEEVIPEANRGRRCESSRTPFKAIKRPTGKGDQTKQQKHRENQKRGEAKE